ncbi:hypothetical protein SteCoe_34379 [Stentor coeruleus]|uniref:Uncharacterized protein n=1 Tax=Stentor coeruleus TaxID=5963 RepID=A0A1R2AUN6_9CILI|nr:hypothetical protein SteCoe_34379 [Stentor coeruleus]
MGCANSKTVKPVIVEKPKDTSSNEVDHVREYYNINENILPNRIRELFQRYFMQQTAVASVIDLKFINLSGPQIKSLEVILPYFTEIRALNLWKTKLGNDGCVMLAKLFHNFPHLSFLSLADNRITRQGISALSDHSSNLKDLEILELHVNPFDADTTYVLATFIGKLTRLRIICLDECEMAGDSLKELMLVLPNAKELERISMDYNFFGESAGNVLINVLGKLKKLKRLSIQHTGISQTVQESLRKVYPDILFTFN